MKSVARTIFSSGSEYGARSDGKAQEQSQGRAEQAEEEDLAPEETFKAIVLHFRPYRQNRANA